MKNVNGMKKLNVKIILMLLAIFAISIQSIEVEAKTKKQSTKNYSKNWEGEWKYGDEKSSDTGKLNIEACNKNKCKLKIESLSCSKITCNECAFDKEIIINNNLASFDIEYSDYNKKDKNICNIFLNLDTNLSKIIIEDKGNCLRESTRQYCGYNGYILKTFIK